MSTRHTGKVKFFNSAKGFGFITRDDGEKDMFFHVSDLGDLKFIADDTAVSFEVGKGRQGEKATNITIK